MEKIKIQTIGKTDILFSPESLEAFVQSAMLGSFSQAAKALNKSQSTISEAIANLEIDVGLALFDRSTRTPTLTEAGKVLFRYAENVLSSLVRFNQMAYQLTDGIEPRLTLAVSDLFPSDPYEQLLSGLNNQFPDLEFRCIVAEDSDILDLIMTQGADIGLATAQSYYAHEISHVPTPYSTNMGVFVTPNHPLAKLDKISHKQLASHRSVQMIPLNEKNSNRYIQSITVRRWSAISYYTVMEMTVSGYGWAELPVWLVEKYAKIYLKRLDVIGWPQQTSLDVAWLKQLPLGKAASWFLERVLNASA